MDTEEILTIDNKQYRKTISNKRGDNIYNLILTSYVGILYATITYSKYLWDSFFEGWTGFLAVVILLIACILVFGFLSYRKKEKIILIDEIKQ